jgi:signal peptidase
MNIKKIASALGLVLLIALVVPFVVYAIPGVVGADGSFIVLSGSMEPEISPGDAVVVTETDPAAIGVGDVITFVRSEEGTPVTHRVVGVEESSAGVLFETKGDANGDVDADLVAGTKVIGVVTVTIPYIGYVVQAVNSTAGFVLLVVAPISLLVASELWSLLKAGRDTEAGAGASSGDEATPASDEMPNADGATDSVGGDGSEVAVAETDGTGDQAAVTLSPDELGLSALTLALVAPYTVYVAFELGTTLSISVAFAAVLSLLAAGGLWLTARLPARRVEGSPTAAESEAELMEEFDPAADGGTVEEGGR